MADMEEVIAAFERLGREARAWVDAQLSVRQDDFQLVPACSSADMKASAAYYPYPPPTTFTVGPPPRSAQERQRFLRITKAEDAFFTKVPVAAPENLLDKVGLRQVGEWRVEMVEDDRDLLLESFDEHQDAVAYASRTLATFVDDEHEYASVGEVPC